MAKELSLRNHKSIALVVEVLVVCLGLGCAHGPGEELRKEWRAPYAAAEVSQVAPKRLQLSLVPGRVDKHSHSLAMKTNVYSENQLLRERYEVTDFTIETKHISKQKEALVFHISTTEKRGTAALNDLAFPKLKQTIETHLTPEAKVKFVKGQKPNGIFYLPPISLPKDLVGKGDTWALSHIWSGADQHTKLRLDVVTILKRFVKCPKKSLCADLEVSGEVHLLIAGKKKQKLSQLTGRIHFEVSSGAIVWSFMESAEELSALDGRVEVKTQLETRLR